MPSDYRSGFISIIGKTNVGKSTLVNRLVGEKVSIVSNKPQTTRNKILSVLTEQDCQIIFIDTPGIHQPTSKLSNYMLKTAEDTLNHVDLILFMTEAKISPITISILQRLEKISTKVLLIINKIDRLSKEDLIKAVERYSKYNFDIIPISAITGENVNTLMQLIKQHLPLGPQYFPSDTLTDQPERQLISELIREKMLLLLNEEIPHGIAVMVEQMEKKKNIVDVNATIYCEREAHKKIIIGANGSMIKKIGTKSRIDIEHLLGSKLNLQLWVKSKKNWRNDNFYLRQFGYKGDE